MDCFQIDTFRPAAAKAPFQPPPHASHAQYSCVFLHARAINFQWHPLCVFMLPPTSPFFTRGLLSLAPAAHRLPLRFILQTANFQSPSKSPATP
jgi:hypothetical protein